MNDPNYISLLDRAEPIIDEKIEKDIVTKRYYQSNETTRDDMAWRIATHVASIEYRWSAPTDMNVAIYEKEFYEAIRSQYLVPSSPIMFNAGTPTKMMSACTGVTFADDSIEAIMKAVTECATLTADGAGVGYDITPLRYRDAPLSRKGVASGACSWLKLMDAVGQTIRQGGRNRRAAMLAALHVNHPDVVEFCHIKDDKSALTHMNISIKVTDEFMRKVDEKEWHSFEFPVGSGKSVVLPVEPKDMDSKDDPRWAVFIDGWKRDRVQAMVEYFPETDTPSKMYVDSVRADWLMDIITSHAHGSGEPGLIFIDEQDDQNPIHSVAPITTTNPCGEIGLNLLTGVQLGLPANGLDGIPVSAHDSCNLAHLTLPRFLTLRSTEQGTQYQVDWDKLREYVELGVRFLDNVIELSEYRPEKIGAANRAIRKVGLGVLGWADMLVMLGINYGSEESYSLAHKLMSFIEYHALDYSVRLVKERGEFSLFGESKYPTEGIEFRAFMEPHTLVKGALSPRSWEVLSGRIKKYGLRNCMVTMLAPTGSTALIVGNMSNSIEPIFFLEQRRRTVDAVEVIQQHWLYREFKAGRLPANVKEEHFVEAFKVTPEQHVAMQVAFQAWTSLAISKTINLPHTATVRTVLDVYKAAWLGGAKGITVYRDGSRDFQPVSNANVQMDDTGKLERVQNATESADAIFRHLKESRGLVLEATKPKSAGFVWSEPELLTDCMREGCNCEKCAPTVTSAATPFMLGVTPEALAASSANKVEYSAIVGQAQQLMGEHKSRPNVADARVHKVGFAGMKVYVTVSRDPVTREPLEIFVNHGKAGTDAMAMMEAIGRLASVALKHGTPIQQIVKQLREIGGETVSFSGGRRFSSLPDAIGQVVQDDLNMETKEPVATIAAVSTAVATTQLVSTGFGKGICPSCRKREYVKQSGCGVCDACGYSQCF